MFRFPVFSLAVSALVLAAVLAAPAASPACPPVAVSVQGGFFQPSFVAVPQASYFVPQASVLVAPQVFAQPLFFQPQVVVVRGRARNAVVVQTAPGVVAVDVAPRVRVRRGLFGATRIRVR